MQKKKILDKTFLIILEKFIATGKGPDYSEIAAKVGVPAPEGRKLLRKVFSPLGFPGWFTPKTDDIASFAPFSNIPNNYKLTIDGEQKWFAQ